jgi:hypothetical protein
MECTRSDPSMSQRSRKFLVCVLQGPTYRDYMLKEMKVKSLVSETLTPNVMFMALVQGGA